MKWKKSFDQKAGSVLISILEIVTGVLLLIDPVGFTGRIIVGVGVLLGLGGILNVVRYFLTEREAAAQKQLLFKGIVSLLAGIACIMERAWFVAAFPLLTVLYAMALLVLAAAKAQKMADMKRRHEKRWYMPGISAVAAALLAGIILWNPFGAAETAWRFAAVSLIAEAIVEILTAML